MLAKTQGDNNKRWIDLNLLSVQDMNIIENVRFL